MENPFDYPEGMEEGKVYLLRVDEEYDLDLMENNLYGYLEAISDEIKATNNKVFASDRNGGFGGFDLWYAVYDGEKWPEPFNFGETINTEYDEYRPIVIRTDKDEFFNNFMIFPSDRPGGMGMFDLYYVGLKKEIN